MSLHDHERVGYKLCKHCNIPPKIFNTGRKGHRTCVQQVLDRIDAWINHEIQVGSLSNIPSTAMNILTILAVSLMAIVSVNAISSPNDTQVEPTPEPTYDVASLTPTMSRE
ncbi:unnamed protein product [Aphanomyces euteiches]